MNKSHISRKETVLKICIFEWDYLIGCPNNLDFFTHFSISLKARVYFLLWKHTQARPGQASVTSMTQPCLALVCVWLAWLWWLCNSYRVRSSWTSLGMSSQSGVIKSAGAVSFNMNIYNTQLLTQPSERHC